MLNEKKERFKDILCEKEISQKIIYIIILFAIFSLISFIGIFILTELGTYIKDISERSIGSFETERLWLVIKSVFLFSSIGFLALLLFYLSSKKVIRIYRENFFLTLLALILSLTIIFGGVFLIDITISPQKIDWNLRDSKNGQYEGKVICYEVNSGRKIIFVAEKAHCDFYPNKKLQYVDNSVDITFKNETSIPKVSKDYQIEFEAPPDVKSLFFRIHTDTNNYKELQVALEHTFMTRSQYEENKKTFLAYFLALMGIVAFTVPQLIIHLREITTK